MLPTTQFAYLKGVGTCVWGIMDVPIKLKQTLKKMLVQYFLFEIKVNGFSLIIRILAIRNTEQWTIVLDLRNHILLKNSLTIACPIWTNCLICQKILINVY